MDGLKKMKEPFEKSEDLNAGQEVSLSLNQKSLNSCSITQEYTSLTLSPLFEIWTDLKEELKHRGEEPKYPLGLSVLDEILWGLHKKELMCIGARTSHGKSAFAINIVKQLADTNQRVIYFSLEMSKEQLLERLFCNLCRVNNLKLRKGQGMVDVLNKEKVFERWLSDAKLLIDDRYGFDFSNIVKICEIIKPDFIIIDYIQMVSSKGVKSKVEAIEDYVRKVKELSLRKDFGTILISQINRSGAKKPGMQYLKWAGVLEEHSDTVLTLNWKSEKGKYEINIEKQRHGETKCNIKVKFLPEYSAFEDY